MYNTSAWLFRSMTYPHDQGEIVQWDIDDRWTTLGVKGLPTRVSKPY